MPHELGFLHALLAGGMVPGRRTGTPATVTECPMVISGDGAPNYGGTGQTGEPVGEGVVDKLREIATGTIAGL